MYQGKRVNRHRKGHKKILVLAVSLVALVSVVIGGTLAWLTADSDPVVNTFNPASVDCQITETFNNDNTQKTSIKVTNTSNIDAYLRVAVVANYVNSTREIIFGTPSVTPSVASNWIRIGDYYYYKSAVAPGTSVDFLASALSLNENNQKLQVTILAEAIQSVPDNAVEAAWTDVEVVNGNLAKKTGGNA